MKIILCSIGKAHDPSLANAIDDFTKRIGNYFKVEWQLIAPPKNAGKMEVAALKKQESELLFKWLQKDDYLILLDEKGKMHSSTSLSHFIQMRANESVKQLVFLIGGAFGVDETVRKRANHVWSFSDLTFPHQVVRLILAEQVYRACTILKNEKYHHP